jgi:hypothetical protein
MLIECSYCKSQVDAKVIASHQEFDPKNDPWPYKISLTVCPSCNNSLIAIQESSDTDRGEKWGSATRAWPNPKRYIPWAVPSIVKSSLEEADRCINAGAYTAAVAM